jgi:hypothetical protein
MIKKGLYLTIFVMVLIMSSSLSIAMGEKSENLKNRHNYDPFDSVNGIYLIIGMFDGISIDDRGYCSKYILDHTYGLIIGYKHHMNEDGTVNETGLVFISLRDMRLIFPTFDCWNIRYIGDNFLCILTQKFSIR